MSRLISAGIKAAEGSTVETTTISSKGVVMPDGSIRDIPGQTVDIKKEVKQIPPNDKLIQFLANTLSRQLGKDDWVTKNFSETKVTGEVQHKIDASAIQKQIEEQFGSPTKYVESRVVQESIPGDVVETE